MVKVEIADVYSRESKDEETGRSQVLSVVLLLDRETGRALPIWMGPFEGQSIAMGLADVEIPRPLTFSFMAGLLDAAGAELEEVRIEELMGKTYFAVATLHVGDLARNVDARPSDAMALAVYTRRPIFVADELIEKWGVPMAEEPGALRPLDDTLDETVRERLAEYERAHPPGMGTPSGEADYASIFRALNLPDNR